MSAAVSLSVSATDYKELLLRAMKAGGGPYSEDITGPVAEMIRGQTGRPDARVVGEVTTVKVLDEPGCRRLNLNVSTPGTYLPQKDGKQGIISMNLKLNMCESGLPPGSITPQTPD